MSFRLKFFAVLASLYCGLAVAQPSSGSGVESWPNRPVKIVIGLPPGSGSDLLARALAQELSDVWKQPVIVDNKPGANGILAANTVAKAPPDGNTLFLAIDANLTTNPFVYKSLPYDPVKDFSPVTMLITFSTVLVAHPTFPAQSIPEMVAKAKAAPGSFSYASIGSGSNMHLLSETFAQNAGIKLLHVPYKGIPQMSTAMLTGEVNLGWLGAFTAKPLIAEGRLKAIAISGSKRSSMLPQVPTFAESGYPKVDMTVWYGLLAPAGTPKQVVDRIHASVSRLIAQPAFRDKHLIPKGYEPSGMGPTEFSDYIRKELPSRAEMVRLAGVTQQE